MQQPNPTQMAERQALKECAGLAHLWCGKEDALSDLPLVIRDSQEFSRLIRSVGNVKIRSGLTRTSEVSGALREAHADEASECQAAWT